MLPIAVNVYRGVFRNHVRGGGAKPGYWKGGNVGFFFGGGGGGEGATHKNFYPHGAQN